MDSVHITRVMYSLGTPYPYKPYNVYIIHLKYEQCSMYIAYTLSGVDKV